MYVWEGIQILISGTVTASWQAERECSLGTLSGRTILARVGQACGLFWSSVSITMSASRKLRRVVSRYFMQCASLMQPFRAFWLPLRSYPDLSGSSPCCPLHCALFCAAPPAHCGAPVVHSSPDHAKDSEVQPTHTLVHPAPSSCHGLIPPECMRE